MTTSVARPHDHDRLLLTLAEYDSFAPHAHLLMREFHLVTPSFWLTRKLFESLYRKEAYLSYSPAK